MRHTTIITTACIESGLFPNLYPFLYEESPWQSLLYDFFKIKYIKAQKPGAQCTFNTHVVLIQPSRCHQPLISNEHERSSIRNKKISFNNTSVGCPRNTWLVTLEQLRLVCYCLRRMNSHSNGMYERMTISVKKADL